MATSHLANEDVLMSGSDEPALLGADNTQQQLTPESHRLYSFDLTGGSSLGATDSASRLLHVVTIDQLDPKRDSSRDDRTRPQTCPDPDPFAVKMRTDQYHRSDDDISVLPPISPTNDRPSNSRSFSTRAPSISTVKLFNSLYTTLSSEHRTSKPRVYFRTDQFATIDCLQRRLHHHLTSNPATHRFYSDWEAADHIRDLDSRCIKYHSEFGGTVEHFVHNCARVNHFLHESTDFGTGTAPNAQNVSDTLLNVEVRLAPFAGAGTSDFAIMDTNTDSPRMLAAGGYKPKLSKERQKQFYVAGSKRSFDGKGYFVEMVSPDP
ncbi:hypothetical protein IAU59_007564 [Kwoniella sp. CBS 9459]